MKNKMRRAVAHWLTSEDQSIWTKIADTVYLFALKNVTDIMSFVLYTTEHACN